MPQEEQTEWPSFEKVLREVAPQSTTANTPPDSPLAQPVPAESREVADPVEIETETETEIARDVPFERSDPSALRELLRTRFSEEPIGADEAGDESELTNDVLDLDNPEPGDLLTSPEAAANTRFAKPDMPPEPHPTEPVPTEPAQAPILDTPDTETVMATADLPPAPAPAPSMPTADVAPAPQHASEPELAMEAQATGDQQLDHAAIGEAATLGDLASDDEEVGDDGWVTHSLHNIEAPKIVAAPVFKPAVADPIFEPEAPQLEPSDTSIDAPSSLDQLLPSTPAPTLNPFSDLFEDSVDEDPAVAQASPSPPDAPSGLAQWVKPTIRESADPEDVLDYQLEPVEHVEPELLEFDDDPIPDNVIPFEHGINFDKEIEFEPVAKANPADLLMDFGDLRPVEEDSAPDPPSPSPSGFDALALYDLNEDTSSAPSTSRGFGGEQSKASGADLFDANPVQSSAFGADLFANDTDSNYPMPGDTDWVSLDSDLAPAPKRPAGPSTGGSDDPWGHMRPDEAPEKISFWENRPKFFGGDDRRKAKAKRAAQERGQNPVSNQGPRACPNCGKPCDVDVRDPSTGRLHLSCDACRHMWFEGGK